MGAEESSSHFVSAALFSSSGGLLTLFHSSSMSSLSQETVLHKLLQHKSFPWAAALHKVPQCGSLPMGCSPSGTGCSNVGPPQGYKPSQQTCSSVGSLPRATGGYLIHRGLPQTAEGQPASPWSSSRAAREHSLLQHLEHILPPSSSMTLVSAELLLSHRLTPLS